MRTPTIVLAIGAVALGIAAPATAARSAHALVAAIAIVLMIVAMQPALLDWTIDRARPFAHVPDESRRAIAPASIRELTDELARPSRVISPRLLIHIRTIARVRLGDEHRPSGVESESRAELSPHLSAILAEQPSADTIPLRCLDDILTELEQL